MARQGSFDPKRFLSDHWEKLVLGLVVLIWLGYLVQVTLAPAELSQRKQDAKKKVDAIRQVYDGKKVDPIPVARRDRQVKNEWLDVPEIAALSWNPFKPRINPPPTIIDLMARKKEEVSIEDLSQDVIEFDIEPYEALEVSPTAQAKVFLVKANDTDTNLEARVIFHLSDGRRKTVIVNVLRNEQGTLNPPKNITAKAETGKIIVRWDPDPETDAPVVGYRVYRRKGRLRDEDIEFELMNLDKRILEKGMIATMGMGAGGMGEPMEVPEMPNPMDMGMGPAGAAPISFSALRARVNELLVTVPEPAERAQLKREIAALIVNYQQMATDPGVVREAVGQCWLQCTQMLLEAGANLGPEGEGEGEGEEEEEGFRWDDNDVIPRQWYTYTVTAVAKRKVPGKPLPTTGNLTEEQVFESERGTPVETIAVVNMKIVLTGGAVEQQMAMLTVSKWYREQWVPSQFAVKARPEGAETGGEIGKKRTILVTDPVTGEKIGEQVDFRTGYWLRELSVGRRTIIVEDRVLRINSVTGEPETDDEGRPIIDVKQKKLEVDGLFAIIADGKSGIEEKIWQENHQ